MERSVREKIIKVVQYFQSVFPPSASFWELPLKLVEDTHRDHIWIIKSFIWKGQSKIMGIMFLKAFLCYFVNHTVSKILMLNTILRCSKGISHLSVIPVLIGKSSLVEKYLLTVVLYWTWNSGEGFHIDGGSHIVCFGI